MIKNIIAPIQTWLLLQKRCVGCGTSLVSAKKQKHSSKQIVTCKCGRVYVYGEKNSYRRAKFDEV